VSERDERLAHAVELRRQDRANEARGILLDLAREFPNDWEVQYQTAWVHDYLGMEDEAVPFYERALALGIPEPEHEGLVLGLGSTYRNVGRVADSLRLLHEGVQRYPDNAALRCFLALAQYSSRDPAGAIATLFDVILGTSSAPSIERYRRALTAYRDELLGVVTDD
jgi:tetratricopeptide (TPR) repeat protein